MEPNIIGVKELHRSIPRITKEVRQGRSFWVAKHNRVIFRIEPPTLAKVIRRKKTVAGKKQTIGRYVLKDFEAIRFSDPEGDPNLSQKIDEIVYGL